MHTMIAFHRSAQTPCTRGPWWRVVLFLAVTCLVTVVPVSGAGKEKSLRRKIGQYDSLKEASLDSRTLRRRSSKSSKCYSSKRSGGGECGDFCSCSSCTQEVLDTKVGAYTCGERIEKLLVKYPRVFRRTREACKRVAGIEFPQECGKCDPSTCDGRTAPAEEEDHCGCTDCTQEVWDRDAGGGYTCGAHITWAMLIDKASEKKACRMTANKYAACSECHPSRCRTSAPNPAPTPVPTPTPKPIVRCGCTDCTADIWDNWAPAGFSADFTCGKRIDYLMGAEGMSELDACRVVSGDQFPNECGAACHPDQCAGRIIPPFTPEPTLAPHTPPLQPETPLYCFRDYANRVRWEDVWGSYTVEVKRHADNDVCGPGENRFSEETVSLNNDEITLQYRKTADGWVGSEVRILLPPEQMPYTYGTYQFSVKTVSVKDASNQIISDALPPSLVLGMFTWDTTDKFDVNEYWSHEVDIELSRWGNPDIMDGQFVIQPPEAPHYYRFWTGPNETMDQGGHVYQFTWNPTQVLWYTDANGGQELEYTTEQAIKEGLTDRIQCLPADVEVRINLWNVLGTNAPMDMEDGHVAEVVIDGFTFTPSGVAGVADGEYCSKHCQCSGDGSLCVNGICTAP